MMKRLKSVSQLPSWIDIEKYSDAENLTAVGWYTSIYARKLFTNTKDPERPYIDCCNPESYSFIKNPIEIADRFKELLKVLRATPLTNLLNNPVFISCCNGSPIKELMNNEWFLSPIHSATPIEISSIINTMSPDKIELMKELCFSGYTDWAHDAMCMHTEPYTNSDVIILNLDLPNETLEIEFKKYLSEQRKKQKQQEAKVSCFKKWHNIGVLPYLDLRIWEQNEGVQIPSHVIADALYPNGKQKCDGSEDESVKRTVKKWAKILMADNGLKTLESIAKLEILKM